MVFGVPYPPIKNENKAITSVFCFPCVSPERKEKYQIIIVIENMVPPERLELPTH